MCDYAAQIQSDVTASSASSNTTSLSLQSQITLMDIPVFKAIQPEVCTLSFIPFYTSAVAGKRGRASHAGVNPFRSFSTEVITNACY